MAAGISVTPVDRVVNVGTSVNEIAAETLQPCSVNSRCIILEIFAGSARLSKACRKLGFEAVAVDQTKDRSEQFPIFQIDVTDSQSLHDLESFIDVEKRCNFTRAFCAIMRNSVSSQGTSNTWRTSQSRASAT